MLSSQNSYESFGGIAAHMTCKTLLVVESLSFLEWLKLRALHQQKMTQTLRLIIFDCEGQ